MTKTGPLAATARDAALAYAVMAPVMPGHFYSTMYGGGGVVMPTPHLHGFSNTGSLKGKEHAIVDSDTPTLY